MNPATRVIKAIISALNGSTPASNPSAQRWAVSLLEPNEVDQKKLDGIGVSQRLIALVDQVDALADLLETTECPRELYAKHLIVIKKSLSPSRLHESWSAVSEGFKPEFLVTLRWAEWLVGPLEQPLTNEDKELLNQRLLDLDNLISSEDLPASLRRVLRNQHNELRNAINKYPTEGLSPLEKAIKTITADVYSEQESLAESAQSQPAETREALTKFKSIMADTVNVLDKTSKTAGNIGNLWSMGKKIIEQLPL